MAQRLKITLGLLVIMHAATACSLFGPRMQTISFASDPPGVEVLIDGGLIGTTPTTQRISRKEEVTILFRKGGYRTEQRGTYRTISTLGLLDMIGGCIILIPFIGLASGAAWEHDPSSFSIVMEKDE